MKTLLQINSVINSGSTGRIAEEIGKKAIENRWQSYIAYGRNEQSSMSKKINIGNKFDILLHGLITRLFDKHGLGSKKATEKLIHQIETINPDIIHLHNVHGYYLNIKVLFNYLANTSIPIIWTLHDCWSFTGHCSHFDFVGCNKWKTECSNCPQIKEYPASFFYDRSNKNYSLKKYLFNSLDNLTIVPVSNWLADRIKESFLSNMSIKVIPNGVDTDLFSPKETNIREKYKLKNTFILLGIASKWTTSKGLSDFIKLSSKIDSDIKIILVGLNKKQIKCLPNNIIGFERTENTEELVNLYSCADVVLNLSREETFGLTTVEGFACGTPGIVYNTTASPELISPETGFVVESGNINKLLHAIKQIQKEGKAYYSNACVERAKSLYNKNDRFNDYMNLYNSVL
jgi:glycosyltransferase involved in cell wall biosynthesis